MTSIILKLLDYFWKFIPKRVKVHFIQNRNNVGFLDTPKKGILMKLESIDSLNRLNSCKKEPETIQWLNTHLNDNDILFDIGANVGAYSLYAAKVIGSKVYSFEPSPSTFRLLLENIHLNNLSHKIIPFNVPLSSNSTMKIFAYSSLDAGTASHAGLDNTDKSSPISQPVFTVTLDELIFKYKVQQPSHMKIDVDGHEFDILKGAGNVLQSDMLKSIQIELSQADHNYAAIIDMLKNFKYSIEHINKHPDSSVTDIVFVK